jgi:hypothetical protein
MSEFHPAKNTSWPVRHWSGYPHPEVRAGRAADLSSAGAWAQRRWAPATAPQAPSRPPEHLLPIIEQLLSGATDMTASQRLELSPRTFSRRVAELLEHLAAESRFQAGVEAACRGWVPRDAGPREINPGHWPPPRPR